SKNEKVLLDFDEVESVSSSFADELIAKLFVSLGAITFTKNIQLKNVNSFTKTIINACIKDRLNDITEC
ncbi:STAS-like domain-containing protein, partial [bacterium]|nr:STAS-like domain-containing protein [bacterium]